MNERMIHCRRLFGVCAAVLLLSGCENTASRGLQGLRLPACSSEGSVFEKTDFGKWATLYHGQIDKVIEAHMKTMRDVDNKPLQCTNADYASLIPPSAPLKEAAAMLPAWKDRLKDLHETDMQSVLMEFLRVYECSLDEHSTFLNTRFDRTKITDIGQLAQEQSDVRDTVKREKALSREALDRTLGIVSGLDRLQPLTLDIECLKRSSLDLRNALGLASDVTSCLPRIWDAKGSLRDLAQ